MIRVFTLPRRTLVKLFKPPFKHRLSVEGTIVPRELTVMEFVSNRYFQNWFKSYFLLKYKLSFMNEFKPPVVDRQSAGAAHPSVDIYYIRFKSTCYHLIRFRNKSFRSLDRFLSFKIISISWVWIEWDFRCITGVLFHHRQNKIDYGTIQAGFGLYLITDVHFEFGCNWGLGKIRVEVLLE